MDVGAADAAGLDSDEDLPGTGQLTDTFQEHNGLYRFDRSPKLDIQRLRKAQTRVAAYEVD